MSGAVELHTACVLQPSLCRCVCCHGCSMQRPLGQSTCSVNLVGCVGHSRHVPSPPTPRHHHHWHSPAHQLRGAPVHSKRVAKWRAPACRRACAPSLPVLQRTNTRCHRPKQTSLCSVLRVWHAPGLCRHFNPAGPNTSMWARVCPRAPPHVAAVLLGSGSCGRMPEQA